MTELTNNELVHTLRTVYRHQGILPELRDRLVSALVELQVRRMDADANARKAPINHEPCGMCGVDRTEHAENPLACSVFQGANMDDPCATCQQPRWAHKPNAPHHVERDHAFVAAAKPTLKGSTPSPSRHDLCGKCGTRRDQHLPGFPHGFSEEGAIYPAQRPYAPPSVDIVQHAHGNSTTETPSE